LRDQAEPDQSGKGNKKTVSFLLPETGDEKQEKRTETPEQGVKKRDQISLVGVEIDILDFANEVAGLMEVG
jgi:hypothetical protein